jgi:MerR family transcriptional regulator, redox-sensitive transcriptional activator SoxR
MLLTIRQVAERAGLRVSAIRYYESRGLVPAAARRSGKRIYDETILDRLAAIELAKAAGLSLAETRDLLTDTSRDRPDVVWPRVARAKRETLEAEIARLGHVRDLLSVLSTCSCASLADCGRAFASARAAGRTVGLGAIGQQRSRRALGGRRLS